MKRGGLPKKFLSRREKNGHHRSRSSDPATHKHRPLSAETFFGLFKTDSGKRLANDENKEEKIALKVRHNILFFAYHVFLVGIGVARSEARHALRVALVVMRRGTH